MVSPEITGMGCSIGQGHSNPQGSVILGPLLFMIYIDGLSGIQLCGHSAIVLFADEL